MNPQVTEALVGITDGARWPPTALLLPTGYSYERLIAVSATRLLTDGLVLADCRSRSTWSAAGQVAELAVRDRSGVLDPDALSVTAVAEPVQGAWSVRVSHWDGRT